MSSWLLFCRLDVSLWFVRVVGLCGVLEGEGLMVSFGMEVVAGALGGEAAGGATSLFEESAVGALWVDDAGSELLATVPPLVVRSMMSAYGQL